MQTLTHDPVPAAPHGPTDDRRDRRGTVITAVLVVAILLVAAIAALLLLSSADEEPDRASPARSAELAEAPTSSGAPESDGLDDGLAQGTLDGPARTGGPIPTTLPTDQPTNVPTNQPSNPPSAPPTTAPAPPTTQPPAPPTTQPAPPALDVTSITAPENWSCGLEAPEQDPKTQLTIAWETVGAVSVSIAIDSPNGVFQNGLPASGSAVVPAPCGGDTSTYYIIARAADGSTVTESATTIGFD